MKPELCMRVPSAPWHSASPGMLLMTLHPDGPYPVLVLNGEQGSGKTTAARMMMRLIDPHRPGIKDDHLDAPPSSPDDLSAVARASWVIGFDNLSTMQPWLSDALCRLSTGGTRAKRKLYSDNDLAEVNVRRPVMLTGIAGLTPRGDLASRAITLHLDVPTRRRSEAQLWKDFEHAAPAVLAGLYDATSAALRHIGEIIEQAHKEGWPLNRRVVPSGG